MQDGEGMLLFGLAPFWLLVQGLAIGLQIFCIVHVIRSSREYYWIFLILFFPVIGSLIYIFVEVRPGTGGRRGRPAGAQRSGGGRGKIKRLEEELEFADTVDRRIRLAQTYHATGDLPKAIEMYASCLKGVHSEDPAVLYPLARAHVENATFPEAIDALGRLRRTGNRDYGKERTLLEGMAHEGMNSLERAAELYGSIANAYPGEEVRVRLASLCERTGKADEALRLYRETLFRAKRSDGAYRGRERQWIAEAQQGVKELAED